MAREKLSKLGRRRALGIGIGAGVGLLLDVALLVWVGFDQFRYICIVTAGLIVFVPVLTGAGIGMRIASIRSKIDRENAINAGKPRVPIRRRMLGVFLGIAGGLLVDALIVLKLRILVLYAVVFSIGLVFIAPIGVGIALGLLFARTKWSRELPWPILALLPVILWPAVVAAPFGARMLHLRSIAHAAAPVYPGARLDKTVVLLGDFENSEDRVRMTYRAAADSSSVLTFYREELTKRRWEPGPQMFIDDRYKGAPHWFRSEEARGSILIKFRGAKADGALSYEVTYYTGG